MISRPNLEEKSKSIRRALDKRMLGRRCMHSLPMKMNSRSSMHVRRRSSAKKMASISSCGNVIKMN